MDEKIGESVAGLSNEQLAEGLRGIQSDIFQLWLGRKNGDLTAMVAAAMLDEAAKRLTS